MKYKFNDNTIKLFNENKTILGNRYNGRWIRMSEEIYNIYNLGIEQGISIETLKEYLFDEEDRNFINTLYNELVSMQIIDDGSYIADPPNKIASFEITHRCNLRCTHCCVDADGVIGDQTELSTNEVKEVLDKIVDWNPLSIMLSGGEPMLRTDFFDILQYLRANYDGNIIISTNATLINNENVEILTSCSNQLEISLDGVDEETCSKVRGKGVFKKVLESINLIQSTGFSNITVSMAVGDKTEHLKDKFIKLNDELGTNHMIRRFGAVGRGKENEHLFSNKKKDEAYIPKEYLDENLQKPFGVSSCKAGSKEIFISHKGDIYPCPSFLDDQYKIVNVFDLNGLSDIKKFYKNKVNDFSILEKINPDMYKNCKDCKVNVFCWTCPGEVEELKESKKSFEDKCNKIKGILYKRVWGC
ncbi:radical SAM/SPASM domain-containing protein [Paraclostridium bifermentans]|uniref:radical SAM/SPASM domain-containing protein n=1 Tax=Paraclostridium bifermentans TaxID=1490 RepID=UPI0018A904B5|nr:radical SAM protein [Paraclostridium bifermentans]